jgi:hypothetical protein
MRAFCCATVAMLNSQKMATMKVFRRHIHGKYSRFGSVGDGFNRLSAESSLKQTLYTAFCVIERSNLPGLGVLRAFQPPLFRRGQGR